MTRRGDSAGVDPCGASLRPNARRTVKLPEEPTRSRAIALPRGVGPPDVAPLPIRQGQRSDWPIPLPGGSELVTFRDAGDSGLVQLALRQLPS
jgi:hypothetical protein